MKIRDYPEPLKIKNFYKKPVKQIEPKDEKNHKSNGNKDGLIESQLRKVRHASVGNRWATVQHVAYTLGGMGDELLIHSIAAEIKANPEFEGEQDKYLKCAKDCFNAGISNPLPELQTN